MPRPATPHPIRGRRAALALLGSLPAWALTPGARAAVRPVRSRPPVARVEPFTETLWGETVSDPYRWMENAKDPEWPPFMRGQADHARAVLDAIPGRKALGERIAQLSGGVPVVQTPTRAGNRLFYESRPLGANQYRLYMRESEAAPERLLIDPATQRMGDNRDQHVSLDWWAASPEGRYVVYGLSPAGSEMSVMFVMDVDSGELLPERIDRTPYAGPNWLPDSSGFFYLRLAEGPAPGSIDYFQDAVCWLHKLRTGPRDDLRVLARGQFAEIAVERSEFPFVMCDSSSQTALASSFGGVRRENPLYTAPLADVLAGKPHWRKVGDVADELVSFAWRADDLYLMTTLAAPNGKVLRVSASAPDLARATTVVPEGESVIEGLSAARDGIYLRCMLGGYGSLRKLGNDGRVTDIPLPFDGSVAGITADTRYDGAWLSGTSWLLPLATFHHDPASGQTRKVPLAPEPELDLSRYEALRSVAVARDGTRVPLSIVARKGLPRDARRPTLVGAYGSYQVVNGPALNARSLAFMDLGGVIATAHVRGGGEYGKRWWHEGQKLSKPNTWRDLIDCCEALVKARWTSPRYLAIQGGSAGGITVAMALTERPDLFAAVISNVGVSNAMRSEFSQNGPSNIDEFGSVTTRAGYLGLKQMDATQHVRAGVRYPAVLLTTGMTDPRVEPWEPAKMAARLQAVPGRVNPVLLRVDFDAGHGVGSTREQIDAQRADEYAFVLWRTGQPGFQPKG